MMESVGRQPTRKEEQTYINIDGELDTLKSKTQQGNDLTNSKAEIRFV